MTELTIVMAVYGQPLMLQKQIDTICTYPPEILKRLNVVIVDDCGTPPVEIGAAFLLASHLRSMRLFRVLEDIPWNQPGARNLGMHFSQGWCVMLDPDMVIPADIIIRMFEAVAKMTRGKVIKFGLKHKHNGQLDMSSPNTWLLNRDDFFAAGGYDEDFSGNKGWSDVQLLNVLGSCYKIQLRPDLYADFYSTKAVADAMVTSLDRSVIKNRAKRIKKHAEAKKAGGWAKWAKGRSDVPRLRFQWKLIYPVP